MEYKLYEPQETASVVPDALSRDDTAEGVLWGLAESSTPPQVAHLKPCEHSAHQMTHNMHVFPVPAKKVGDQQRAVRYTKKQ